MNLSEVIMQKSNSFFYSLGKRKKRIILHLDFRCHTVSTLGIIIADLLMWRSTHFIHFTILNTLLFFVFLQMVCSCCFLYLLRRWRMISFTANESLLISDNSTKFVSLKTLKHTFPLSGAYLFYMVYPFPSCETRERILSKYCLLFSIHPCTSP